MTSQLTELGIPPNTTFTDMIRDGGSALELGEGLLAVCRNIERQLENLGKETLKSRCDIQKLESEVSAYKSIVQKQRLEIGTFRNDDNILKEKIKSLENEASSAKRRAHTLEDQLLEVEEEKIAATSEITDLSQTIDAADKVREWVRILLKPSPPLKALKSSVHDYCISHHFTTTGLSWLSDTSSAPTPCLLLGLLHHHIESVIKNTTASPVQFDSPPPFAPMKRPLVDKKESSGIAVMCWPFRKTR